MGASTPDGATHSSEVSETHEVRSHAVAPSRTRAELDRVRGHEPFVLKALQVTSQATSPSCEFGELGARAAGRHLAQPRSPRSMSEVSEIHEVRSLAVPPSRTRAELLRGRDRGCE